MSYTKLFGSMLASTVWDLPHATRIVWVTMLAMKDRDGVVEASVPGLALLSRVTRAEVDAAIATLEAPDPDSRTKDHDGRRIEPIDGGWIILNHDKYRDKLDGEDVREKKTKRQRRWRDREQERNKNRGMPSGRRSETLVDAGRRSETPVTPCRSDADADHPDRVRVVPDSPLREPPDRGASRDLEQHPACQPASPAHVSPARQLADRADIRGRGFTVPPPPNDPAAALRRSLVDTFVKRVNDARTRLARELKLGEARAIALMDGIGEPQLIERLKASPDPAAELDHVLRVAEAEARSKRELRWLGWSLAEPKAWRIRASATLREVGAPIPRSSSPPAREPEPSPAAALTEEDRAEIAELTRRLAENPQTAAAKLDAERTKKD